MIRTEFGKNIAGTKLETSYSEALQEYTRGIYRKIFFIWESNGAYMY